MTPTHGRADQLETRAETRPSLVLNLLDVILVLVADDRYHTTC